MGQGYAFMPDALESNAAGKLTEAQRAMFRHGSWMMRWLPTLTGDLRHGAVRCIEGPYRKVKPLNMNHSTTNSGVQQYAFEVAGESFDVPSASVWEAAPPVGYVRLYYLPRSRTAVNLERLPDPPVDVTPESVLGAVTDALGAALRPAVSRHGLAAKDERMAHADVVMRAAMGGGGEQTTPTPETTADAASNQEGLVGLWKSVFFDVEVRADQTLTLHMTLQGTAQHGQWRFGPDAQLHVRFDGTDEADELVTPVALTGDRLTLAMGDQQITLQRPAP